MASEQRSVVRCGSGSAQVSHTRGTAAAILVTAPLYTSYVNKFKVVSDFAPAGDQPAAIKGLVERIEQGNRFNTLLGATGTGKTATVAWAIEQIQKPTLVIAPNKSLAAQLCNEFKSSSPRTRSSTSSATTTTTSPRRTSRRRTPTSRRTRRSTTRSRRLRHSRDQRTASAQGRADRGERVVHLRPGLARGVPATRSSSLARGGTADRDFITQRLVDIQYERNDVNFIRGKFRVRGDTIEIFPAYEELAIRVELFGDEVDRIIELDPLTGEITRDLDHVTVYPASHYVASRERMEKAIHGDRSRAQGPAPRARERAQAARGPATEDADRVRPRDDARGRVLLRHRELLPPHRRARSRGRNRTR